MSQDFFQFVQRLYRAVRQTLLRPQADPRQTLIVGLILILVTAIMVLIGLSIYSRVGGKKRTVRRRKARPLTPRERFTIWGIVAAVFLVFVLAGYVYVEQPSFCANCHTEQKEFESWQKSSHRNMGCLACHRSPGLSGYAIQKIDYLRWAWNFAFAGYRMPLRASVGNSTCRKCHSNLMQEVVVSRGVRVRHKDFLEKGSRCTDCHNTVGHEPTIARYPSMDKCITCHNTKSARAGCSICHTTTPRTRQTPRDAVRIGITPQKQCRGCHKASTWERCIRCHGLEMPHPEGWMGGHSRLAFLHKELCLKCHTFPPKDKRPGAHGGQNDERTFCNQCHRFPSPHGTAERWARLHGPVALRTITIGEKLCIECHEVRSRAAAGIDADLARCDVCHSPQICDGCHKPGKYSSYQLQYSKF